MPETDKKERERELQSAKRLVAVLEQDAKRILRILESAGSSNEAAYLRKALREIAKIERSL
jgi:hypothetical protein